MWKHNIQKEFMETQKLLTLQGYIVISVGLFGHSGDEEVWEGMDENTLTQTKVMLDDMHKRKIDMELMLVDILVNQLNLRLNTPKNRKSV